MDVLYSEFLYFSLKFLNHGDEVSHKEL